MDKRKIRLFLAVGLFWVSAQVDADVQIEEGLALIARANTLQVEKRREESPLARQETAEIKILGIGMIRLYQRYIATQDLPVCNFQPSCSAFGAQAIQRFGFFRGVLLAADRLMRDNGQNLGRHYRKDEVTGRYYDPVESYAPEMLK